MHLNFGRDCPLKNSSVTLKLWTGQGLGIVCMFGSGKLQEVTVAAICIFVKVQDRLLFVKYFMRYLQHLVVVSSAGSYCGS